MGKLNLKSTPAEDAQRAYKKARKEARRSSMRESERDYQRRKRKRVHESYDESEAGPSRYADKLYVFEDEQEAIRVAQAEDDARFREKMMDALADDGLADPLQRLDGVETRMNDYAHIPRRWRGTEPGFADALRNAEEDIGLETWQMNDDEYAEYVRAGIWRRQNRAELDSRRDTRKQHEERARYARSLREETARLEREERERKQRKKMERKRKAQERVCAVYEARWAKLLDTDKRANEDDPGKEKERELVFADVPWPVLVGDVDEPSPNVRVDEITPEAITAFLRISVPPSPTGLTTERLAELLNTQAPAPLPTNSIDLKDVLRTTMLRFHPDKFEARVLKRIRSSDRERVKEAASAVVRAVGELMRDGKK